MQKLRGRIIDCLLKHDGLIAVPSGWEIEYVKLAGDKVRLGQTITDLMKAYNELLEEDLKRCNIAEIKEMIKDAGIKIPKDANKETLINIAYNEYKMRKEGK